ncbi:MAG: helix-turn-helix transcriptional regulator [Eubacterium sp.]|nr:helix-turn-helix transcriptional regulator [Eubacterium sp.]
MVNVLKKYPLINICLSICLYFTLISTAYMAWVYHVTDLLPSRGADFISLVAAYLMQAAGIGIFALVLNRRKEYVRNYVSLGLAVHLMLLFPALLTEKPPWVILFGLVMNLVSGFISGYYLYLFSTEGDRKCKGLTLGLGYSASIFLSWLLSFLTGKSGCAAEFTLVTVIALSAGGVVLTYSQVDSYERHRALGQSDYQAELTGTYRRLENAAGQHSWSGIILPAGLLIVLFGIVMNCGYTFSAADIDQGISIEFSRLFYAAALLIAGFINDRSRIYGSVLALAFLTSPFVLYAMRGEAVGALFFWALSYFSLGFFTIYRILLFSDMSKERGLLPVCSLGLVFGRMGDALGEGLCLGLASHFPVLLFVTSCLFICTVFLFFRVSMHIYQHGLEEEKQMVDARALFNTFSAEYALSAREREVLQFLLEEKSNIEIAEELAISESTVKFHIHNLLQKTGEKNRVALIASYYSRNL